MPKSHFSEEHQLFRKQVRTFVEQELLPHADAWEAAEIFPRSVFERAGALGIIGAHYPESVGGGGGDFWFSVAKAEELSACGSAGVALALLVQSDMATPIIWKLGSDYHKREFLEPALRGEKIGAIGVTEPNAGSDVSGIRTTAKLDGDHYVINGSKTFITNGTRCDFITLLAKTDAAAGHHGISMFTFPTQTNGFSVSKKLKKLGNIASDTAELFFEDCRVPKQCLLGQEGMGFIYLMQNFQSERLIGAVSSLASARRALDRSVSYGRDRSAFGKPLIKREVWQHKFVDLYTKLEAAQALTYRACEYYNEDVYEKGGMPSLETGKLVSMSKLLAGDVVDEVMDACMQFHGGMGYLEDFWVARAWRDARLLRIGGGASEVLRYLIAKVMNF
ncbi:MAG: acyl-CoA dehydrogenase family protein [Myxococcales bacterium]